MISRERDARFSRIIRERDQWRCRNCGRQYVVGDPLLQAAHCFTRGIPATRYDEDNVLALCGLVCHPHVDRYPAAKERLWRREIGSQAYEALSAKAHGRRDRV